MTDDANDGLTPQATDKEATIERDTPEDRPIFYSNIVALGSSVWDFTMDFGMIQESGRNRLRFQDSARVIMSPQQARVFSEVLAQHVKQYEEKFGKIPRPSDEELIKMRATDG